MSSFLSRFGDYERLSHEEIRRYLDHILTASHKLTLRSDAMDIDMDENQNKILTGSDYMVQIARNLLDACELDTLTLPTTHLPPNESIDWEMDKNVPWEPLPELPPDSMIATEPYEYRRVDYLRRMLRSMAPISFDVAAHACSTIAASFHTPSTSVQKDGLLLSSGMATSAVVLFSTWLPVAPHLAPLVTELFSHPNFPCPLTLDECHQKSNMVMEVAQAIHSLCRFYASRREYSTLATWSSTWNWSVLSEWMHLTWKHEPAIRWHAVRALGFVLQLSSCRKADYYKSHGVQEEQVQWVIHPWEIEEEESTQQEMQLQGRTLLWNSDILCPGSEQIRDLVPLHPYLVEIGPGLVFCRHHTISSDVGAEAIGRKRSSGGLVRSVTTQRNMDRLAAAMTLLPHPPAILLCGAAGSGKSSLVREVNRLILGDSSPDAALLELHVDDETDTKTLIGSYTSSDAWGEFEWRPGALTLAARQGRWVLVENVDKVPAEIHAALTQLFEERLLPLGGGKVELCHPNFRLFGTITVDSVAASMDSIDRRLLNADLWHKVPIESMPPSELKEVVHVLYPAIPESLIDATVSIFDSLASFKAYQKAFDAESFKDGLWIGRNASVRDLFKVFSRINTHEFERDVTYTTERQRCLCLAEVADVFVSAAPDRHVRRHIIQCLAAPKFGLSTELALLATEKRAPQLQIQPTFTEIGRVRLHLSPPSSSERRSTDRFALTGYTLRLMESIGVCVRENESVLLVGETGGGKTSILQELARLSGRELVVQNLSLQTDSNDILGGYRPLEVKNIAKSIYQDFVDLFSSTFSRKQNARFLEFASTLFKKEQWDKLSQCFRKAVKLGLGKVEKLEQSDARVSSLVSWQNFDSSAKRFEQQRIAAASGMAFVFSEGALVDAIRKGKWVLLDEINLASSETLQRLCGLLDDSSSSLTLTERGDAVAIDRNANFRLFAAMNPATDAGKKELHASIRTRFTEIFVDEVLDPVELRKISGRYLCDVLASNGRLPEHTETVMDAVGVYLRCREHAESILVDGNGQRPRYSLRTLTRALTASRALHLEQKLPLKRALLEGFELSFQGPLDAPSAKAISNALTSGLKHSPNDDQPGRRPGGRDCAVEFVLIKPFWIKAGPLLCDDWSKTSDGSTPNFILTETTAKNLRKLARAVASGPWPVLLEGPTGAGKTNLIQYLAARCGHHIIRINNHEHTDIQEYTGCYAADASGSLAFHDGLLVQALRKGHWVILDELNLAPCEVLEALNRLLDDNRELFLPETNEIVKPHPNFRLFATQNPSGVYGGRKPLSRAFRNRFVEIHVCDLPTEEMVKILEDRCACPPSHAKCLVSIMEALRQRRSQSGLFLGKDGSVTPRDLLRWAYRGGASKLDLAREGFMLLAERLRTPVEVEIVRKEIEAQFKVKIDIENHYFGPSSQPKKLFDGPLACRENLSALRSIAPTKAFLRLAKLVCRCMEQNEPALLVGDTGNGKTTVVQLLAMVNSKRLHVINCHATTETADLLGGLRPLRGRAQLARSIVAKAEELMLLAPGKIVDAVLESQGGNFEDRRKSVERMVELLDGVWGVVKASLNRDSSARVPKRPKLDMNLQSGPTSNGDVDLVALYDEIKSLYRRYNGLFEWVDGPLVEAMKRGEYVLLDEINLADDAVLERLNSVLEPTRTIVLAEKGSPADGDLATLRAKQGFQLFATMNPGGDYGKRELSPALRNRFTEIWVPPVTDLSDIEVILERALLNQAPCSGQVKSCMMEYLDWFNREICSDPRSPSDELSLSLRDVITWVDFIVTGSKHCTETGAWEMYREGVYLMHLDGLGLGTGISREWAGAILKLAEAFLLNQLSKLHVRPFQSSENSGTFQVIDEKFGKSPFWIETGSFLQSDTRFNFDAPTTSANLHRVLRGLQLSKPILIEGPPGAGKTGLVEALASAAGHRLVRINFSEQTEISDLFGCDLPHSDESSDSLGAFQWCDGVLLSAIKSGDWVLLDELNLAPQAVLEGLNSCLDHRSTIYIPEIGQSFACPSTFRVFAAQNPIAQGGGRKGLPKSFLNRFTKVYVNGLSSDDFECITQSRFPEMSARIVAAVVNFNSQIHDDATVRLKIGRTGGPWEFNLRDIFRWCELQGSFPEPVSCAPFARDLYAQRFRSRADRNAVATVFEECFQDQLLSPETMKVAVNSSCVRIGDVVLPKSLGSNRPLYESMYTEPDSFQSLIVPKTAVARAVTMRWPCLLVGNARAETSAIIKGLANLVGVNLTELSLTASSDVSELVGCFEQINMMDRGQLEIQTLVDVAVEYATHADFDVSSNRSIDLSLQLLRRNGQYTAADVRRAATLASILSESKGHVMDLSTKKKVESSTKALTELLASQSKSDKGRFVWKDGPLIEAMLNGDWIHLKNVNVCPSTVLDRLNPVFEPGGSLLLSECGLSSENDGLSLHRQIKPHPNFMVFLSMDPMHGELSRAMRNRCLEICVLDANNRNGSQVDSRTLAWKHGLRARLACPFDDDKESRSVLCNSEWITKLSRCISSSATRGMRAKRLQELHSLEFDPVHCTGSDSQSKNEHHCLSPFPYPAVREGWQSSPLNSKIEWEGQILKVLICRRRLRCKYDAPFGFAVGHLAMGSWLLRSILMNRFMCRRVDTDFLHGASFLSRLSGNSAAVLRLLANHCNSFLKLFGTQNDLLGGTLLQRFLLSRGPQCLEEARWLVSNPVGIVEGARSSAVNILQVSRSLLHGGAKYASVTCAITPLLLPLFDAFDNAWERASSALIQSAMDESHCLPIINVVNKRDELWNLSNRLIFLDQKVGKFQFEETEFIILWGWFRECFTQVEPILRHSLETDSHHSLDKLRGIVQAVDESIYEGDGDPSYLRRTIERDTSKPLVPKCSDLWALALEIKETGQGFSVYEESCEGATTSIELRDLIDMAHPTLFIPLKLKLEVVAVLCMTYLSCLEIESPGYSVPHIGREIGLRFNEELRSEKIAFVEASRILGLSPSDMSEGRDVSCNDSRGPEGARTFMRASDDLLARFARIQLSPLAEYWCERMETYHVEEVSGLLLGMDPSDGLTSLLTSSSIFRFITFLVTHSQWTASEIQPYKTLSWLLELAQDPSRNLMKRLIHSMSCNALSHEWNGSRQHFTRLSWKLELPVQRRSELRKEKHSIAALDASPVDVPSATVFALVGKEFRQQFCETKVPIFITLENFRARERQVQEILRMLAMLEGATKPLPLKSLTFSFLESLQGLGAVPNCEEFLTCLTKSRALDSTDDAYLEKMLTSIHTKLILLDIPERTVGTIWTILRRLWTDRKSENNSASLSHDLAIVKVNLGLLRFHLRLPASPVDPGLRPLAELKLFNHRIERLRIDQLALDIESEVISDEFNNVEKRRVESRIQELDSMRARAERSIITRPEVTLEFVDLYHEIHGFAKKFMTIAPMIEFTDVITSCTSGDVPLDSVTLRANQWQKTSQLFSNRLLTKYVAYDDVTIPLVDAIGMVQSGLHSLTKPLSGGDPLGGVLAGAVSYLTQFPMDISDVNCLKSCASSLSKELKDEEAHRLFGFAALSRIVLSTFALGMECQFIRQWSDFMEKLIPSDSVTSESPLLSDDDVREREFQSQFPDFRRSFSTLLISEFDADEQIEETDTSSSSAEWLQDIQIDLLVSLHADLFSDGQRASSSAARSRAFRLSYCFACHLYEKLGSQVTLSSYSGHVMALCMCAISMNEPSSTWHLATSNDDFVDFHHDPCPKEASLAATPLDDLLGRIVQLLSLFPENSILLAILTAIERVRRLSLVSCSLGHVMVGLEVILKNAQDWEQHASERFCIGEPLIAVSRLVARWRKLELQSWPELIKSREKRSKKRSWKFWVHLHRLLKSMAYTSPSFDNYPCEERVDQFIPKWVWKGCHLVGQKLTTHADDVLIDVTEVMKTLDTFMLTATIGEFETRLSMIRSFAFQQELECNWGCKEATSGLGVAVSLSRTLWFLWSYYKQFSPAVAEKLTSTRRTFEKQLADQAKIAKWDEQTYYSLAETSERNHRKVMSVLRQFDEARELNVAVFLEGLLGEGVQHNEVESDCSAIPCDKAMFPNVTKDEIQEFETGKDFNLHPIRAWENASALGAEDESHVNNMARLYGRITSIYANSNTTKSWAVRGHELATSICNAIFDRIESLRSPKATKPMKERALVDLLKELKCQGFASGKSSLPLDATLMSRICLLPCWKTWRHQLTTVDVIPVIESCDNYLQRCLAESNYFRTEIGSAGSRHLTSRQVHVMRSVCDSGILLLLQQRSALLTILTARSRLATLTGSISRKEMDLPAGQSNLRSLTTTFLKRYRLCCESLEEVCVFLKNASCFVKDPDILHEMQSFAFPLEADWQLSAGRDLRVPVVQSQGMIRSVAKRRNELLNAKSSLRNLQQRILDHLPSDALGRCIACCEDAILSAQAIIEFVPSSEISLHSNAVNDYVNNVTDAVEAVLLSVQAWATCNISPLADSGCSDSIWVCHKHLLKSWASINVQRLTDSYAEVLESLVSVHDEAVESSVRNTCTRLASDLVAFVEHGLTSTDQLILESAFFHREVSKLLFVLLRVFRVLVSKGFCESKHTDDSTSEGEVQTGATAFNDQDGTGMGEGEGRQDVTDQLDSEDQMLGLKGQDADSRADSTERKQLDKEEVNTGMEMSADFDGDEFDVPQPSSEDESHLDDDCSREELDREMGDSDLMDEVVDERMWNDDDKNDETSSEKFEDDNNVKGEGASDEITTKQDTTEDETAEPTQGNASNGNEDVESDSENLLNDNHPDDHEEHHGVRVGQDDSEKNEGEDGLEVNDSISLSDEEPDIGETAAETLNSEPGNDESSGEEMVPDVETATNEDHDESFESSVAEEEGVSEPVPSSAEPLEAENPDDSLDQDVMNRECFSEESRSGLGVTTNDGKDAVISGEVEESDQINGERTGADTTETDTQSNPSDGNALGERSSEPDGTHGPSIGESTPHPTGEREPHEIPNPLKNPGDAAKFWHRKLNVVHLNGEGEDESSPANGDEGEFQPENIAGTGDFDNTNQLGPNTTQALGDADEENAMQFEDQEIKRDDSQDENGGETNETPQRPDLVKESKSSKGKASSEREKRHEPDDALLDEMVTEDSRDLLADNLEVENESVRKDVSTGSHVVSDTSRLNDRGDSVGEPQTQEVIVDDEFACSQDNVLDVVSKWYLVQSETNHLSRRLCEKLRLVMEPLVMSKLRGDYRTGKRINMKRVIGYIASGYRRDKIWLRRTKPAKRNYRVLVAVDDSESMRNSGAGDMALKAMATLATGMSQLDVGQIGLASFGEDMRLLHPFDQPFTQDCGPNLLQSFSFSQKRTRTALCVESTMMALEVPGDHASMQLVFMISDGRIERDSRDKLRRLLREMHERNILLALIIVEGKGRKDSILDMKEVSFVNGKPHVKRFIEDYPFPYYIILEDMQALPEVLGDALRQWFEMIARLQGNSS